MLHARRQADAIFFQSPLLSAIPGIVHAFSTRRAGNSELSFRVDEGSPEAPRQSFLAAAGFSGWPVLCLKQIHSDIVHWIVDPAASTVPEGDAAGTATAGVALGVLTADCVPILIADRNAGAVGVVHAGWRGTSASVSARAVERFGSATGGRADSLVAVIGPHIGVCCMEVGEAVVEQFPNSDLFERRPGWRRPHLNLALANQLQLVEAGLPSGSIQVSNLCTRCNEDLFHSYRRDRERAGRMLSVIGIRTGRGASTIDRLE